MKKIPVFLLIVALAISILFINIGCKQESAAGETTSAETTEAAAETTAAAEETQTVGEEATVSVLFGETADWHVPETNIAEFYALNPNIKVNFTFLSQKEMTEKARLELASGSSAYDIIYYDDQLAPTYISAGWLAPLDSYVERDAAELEADDFFTSAYNACKEGDSVYGLPFYQEAMILYFNAELFDKYDVKVPETLDEWMDAASKLTIKDETGKQLYGVTLRGFKGPGSVTYSFTAFLKAFGSGWLDENYKPIFNNEGGKAAAKWYADMLLNYAPPGVTTFKWNECLSSFEQGESATFADATVFGNWIEDPEQSTVVGKVGFITIPNGPNGSIPSSYVAMHGINANSKNKDAAWEFLKWMNGKSINYMLGLPSRKSSYEIESVAQKFDLGVEGYKYIDALQASLDAAQRPFPPIPEWNEVSSIVSDAIDVILTGGDINQSLDSAASEVEALLQNAGYYK